MHANSFLDRSSWAPKWPHRLWGQFGPSLHHQRGWQWVPEGQAGLCADMAESAQPSASYGKQRIHTWTYLEYTPVMLSSTQQVLHKHLANKEAHTKTTDICIISWENRESVIKLPNKVKTDIIYGTDVVMAITVTRAGVCLLPGHLFSAFHTKWVINLMR